MLGLLRDLTGGYAAPLALCVTLDVVAAAIIVIPDRRTSGTGGSGSSEPDMRPGAKRSDRQDPHLISHGVGLLSPVNRPSAISTLPSASFDSRVWNLSLSSSIR